MGKKKKKKPEDSGPEGAPEWVVTFTDMISLLVTFFVLLMTFSTITEDELLRVDAWQSGRRGLLESEASVAVETPDEDYIASIDLQRGALKPHSRPPDELDENLAEMGQKRTDEHLALDLNDVADGLIIDFGPAESFAPGSVEVPPALAKSLGEIGRVLEHYPHMVVIEGFTDTAFKPTPEYPSAEAISFARASNAAQILLRDSKMAIEQVQIAGYGAREPRSENETAEGRQQNRRVQIRVLSLSKARASQLEAQRAHQSEVNDG